MTKNLTQQQQIARTMSEAELVSAILDLAAGRGWLATHFRPAISAGIGRNGRQRWLTPIQGKAGFPDLVMVREKDGRLLFWECKSERGSVDAAQQQWLDALAACPGVDARVVRPMDWLQDRVLEWLA